MFLSCNRYRIFKFNYSAKEKSFYLQIKMMEPERSYDNGWWFAGDGAVVDLTLDDEEEKEHENTQVQANEDSDIEVLSIFIPSQDIVWNRMCDTDADEIIVISESISEQKHMRSATPVLISFPALPSIVKEEPICHEEEICVPTEDAPSCTNEEICVPTEDTPSCTNEEICVPTEDTLSCTNEPDIKEEENSVIYKTETESSRMAKFFPGDKVFAKMRGWRPWPAKVESVGPWNLKQEVKYNVIFYGTYQTAVCRESKLYPYFEYKEKYGSRVKRKMFQLAMTQIEDREDFSLSKTSRPSVRVNGKVGTKPVKQSSLKQIAKQKKERKTVNVKKNNQIEPNYRSKVMPKFFRREIKRKPSSLQKRKQILKDVNKPHKVTRRRVKRGWPKGKKRGGQRAALVQATTSKESKTIEHRERKQSINASTTKKEDLIKKENLLSQTVLSPALKEEVSVSEDVGGAISDSSVALNRCLSVKLQRIELDQADSPSKKNDVIEKLYGNSIEGNSLGRCVPSPWIDVSSPAQKDMPFGQCTVKENRRSTRRMVVKSINRKHSKYLSPLTNDVASITSLVQSVSVTTTEETNRPYPGICGRELRRSTSRGEVLNKDKGYPIRTRMKQHSKIHVPRTTETSGKLALSQLPVDVAISGDVTQSEPEMTVIDRKTILAVPNNEVQTKASKRRKKEIVKQCHINGNLKVAATESVDRASCIMKDHVITTRCFARERGICIEDKDLCLPTLRRKRLKSSASQTKICDDPPLLMNESEMTAGSNNIVAPCVTVAESQHITTNTDTALTSVETNSSSLAVSESLTERMTIWNKQERGVFVQQFQGDSLSPHTVQIASTMSSSSTSQPSMMEVRATVSSERSEAEEITRQIPHFEERKVGERFHIKEEQQHICQCTRRDEIMEREESQTQIGTYPIAHARKEKALAVCSMTINSTNKKELMKLQKERDSPHVLQHIQEISSAPLFANKDSTSVTEIQQNVENKPGSSYELRKHTANNEFTCHVCDRAYHEQDYLTHLKRYTGGRTNHKYECKGIMSKKKHHKCSTCGKRFYHFEKLQMHSATHSKMEVLQDLKCGKSYLPCSNIHMHCSTNLSQPNYLNNPSLSNPKLLAKSESPSMHFAMNNSEHLHSQNTSYPINHNDIVTETKFAPHQCVCCEMISDKISSHSTHGTHNRYYCHTCKSIFPIQADLVKHVMDHVGTESNLYQSRISPCVVMLQPCEANSMR